MHRWQYRIAIGNGDRISRETHHAVLEASGIHEADPDFIFAQKMTRYYDLKDTKGVFYDNFAPGKTQLFRDSATYGANWEALQNASRSVRHALTSACFKLCGKANREIRT
jgi:hypothetical protein